MAELLRNSRYEEQHGKIERMAVPPDTDVYLEAMEAATNPEAKADGLRAAGMGGLRGSIQPKILLADVEKRCAAKSLNKTKTDRMGIL